MSSCRAQEGLGWLQVTLLMRISLPVQQVGSIPANAADDGQWSQGLISAVSPLLLPLHLLCGFP